MSATFTMSDVQAELSRISEAARDAVGDLRAEVLDLQQRAALRGSAAPEAADSFGSHVEKAFSEVDARAALKRGGKLTLEVPFPRAAITTTGTGGSVGSGGVPNAPGMVSTSLSAMMTPGDLAGMTSMAYSRRTGVTGSAGVQPGEGGLKSVSEPVFTPVNQAAITIAAYCVVSEQSLAAEGGLRRAVDSHLQRAVRLAVDQVLLAGTAEPAWPFTGYLALAAPFTATGWVSTVDALIAGATRMRTEGFNPTIAVVSESAFLESQLAKAVGSGAYLMAATLLRDAGVRLALSESVPAGKSLLVDESFIGYLASGATSVTLGLISDQFIRNQITVRAELQILPFVADFQGSMLISPATA